MDPVTLTRLIGWACSVTPVLLRRRRDASAIGRIGLALSGRSLFVLAKIAVARVRDTGLGHT